MLGSHSHIFFITAADAAEWDAVPARWADEDHTLMQPVTPCWIMPLL